MTEPVVTLSCTAAAPAPTGMFKMDSRAPFAANLPAPLAALFVLLSTLPLVVRLPFGLWGFHFELDFQYVANLFRPSLFEENFFRSCALFFSACELEFASDSIGLSRTFPAYPMTSPPAWSKAPPTAPFSAAPMTSLPL